MRVAGKLIPDDFALQLGVCVQNTDCRALIDVLADAGWNAESSAFQTEPVLPQLILQLMALNTKLNVDSKAEALAVEVAKSTYTDRRTVRKAARAKNLETRFAKYCSEPPPVRHRLRKFTGPIPLPSAGEAVQEAHAHGASGEATALVPLAAGTGGAPSPGASAAQDWQSDSDACHWRWAWSVFPETAHAARVLIYVL